MPIHDPDLPQPHHLLQEQSDVMQRLIELLNKHNALYRLVEHPAAGSSHDVAQARGSRLEQGAKALVFQVFHNDKRRTFVLAVVPSHARVSSSRLASVLGAQKVRLATPEDAEQLTGCRMGCVPPFSFNIHFPVIVDPALLTEEEIVFNAGSLEKSIFLKSADYQRITCFTASTITE